MYGSRGLIGHFFVVVLCFSSGCTLRVDSRLSNPQITLPIEVFLNSSVESAISFPIKPSQVAKVSSIRLTTHGIKYKDQARFRVNGGTWLPFDESVVEVLGSGKKFGGIGGAFISLKLSIPMAKLPANSQLVSGTNRVELKNVEGHGVSTAFRLLKFNVIDAEGTSLLPDSLFAQEDPATWAPPLSGAGAIAEGKRLWYQGSLVDADGKTLRARCTSCHAQDGRDLKYFNFSNDTIRNRALFHGLNSLQGDQIASYIRTLNVPNPGRPWNPPYQPGPGIDSRPGIEWAAGAGLDAVLDTDTQTYKSLFPNGFEPKAIALDKNLNPRETPIALQLPDWNHWLPRVHPLDAFPDFAASQVFRCISREGTSTVDPSPPLREVAASVRKNDYKTFRSLYRFPAEGFHVAFNKFLSDKDPTISKDYSDDHAVKIYSLALWRMVKLWEVDQEYDLEAHWQQFSPSSLAPLGEPSIAAFDTSPNILHLKPTANIIHNNTDSRIFHYFSLSWYHLQLMFSDGGSGPDFSEIRPIDWGYVHGFIANLSVLAKIDLSALNVLYFVKGMQVVARRKLPMNDPSHLGWGFYQWGDFMHMLLPEGLPYNFRILTDTERGALFSALLRVWLDESMSWAKTDYYIGGSITEDSVPESANYGGPHFLDRLFTTFLRFHSLGVEPALIAEGTAWLKSVWPKANWPLLNDATCYSNYQEFPWDMRVCSVTLEQLLK